MRITLPTVALDSSKCCASPAARSGMVVIRIGTPRSRMTSSKADIASGTSFIRASKVRLRKNVRSPMFLRASRNTAGKSSSAGGPAARP